MGKSGTKSMEESRVPDLDYVNPGYATPEIAESWRLFYEQEDRERPLRRERPDPRWMDVWFEIYDHPGIS